ncbi:MAG: molybdopterin-guanine dinucleotide biosynthesis protein B [Alphaproteobacteria bacterium]|nr:molybdopterin-guanine dinucleotide biosynthesis protein B [Alphaproteobacteria bacterium]
MNKVLGIAGFKNTGKTTLVEKLVAELTRRGYRISTVKHAHHSVELDHEGRDSFRHKAAGAAEVAVISRLRWTIVHELRGNSEPTLEYILSKLDPCDLVLVEGYKHGKHNKIEVRNVGSDHPLLADEDPSVIAIAANGDVPKATIPVFPRDDINALATFIERQVVLT